MSKENVLFRVYEENKIKDYMLFKQTDSVIVDGVTFGWSNEDWFFSSSKTVYLNGIPVTSGSLKLGDTLIINYEFHRGALMLPLLLDNHISLADYTNEILIGRNENCDVRIDNQYISSRHCRLYIKGESYFIEDLNSRNGSYVNGTALCPHTECKLFPKDQICIGPFKILFDPKPYIKNADKSVTLNSVKAENFEESKMPVEPYPYFARTARILEAHPDIDIAIEQAPQLGEKPSMQMGGIALNWQLLALSVGVQGIRYFSSKKKYNKQEKERAKLYSDYLNALDYQAEEHCIKRQAVLKDLYPVYQVWMNRALKYDSHMWEKNFYDEDFTEVRLGLGTLPSGINFSLPHKGLSLKTDEFDAYPNELASKYREINDVPITYSFKKRGSLGIVGNEHDTTQLIRSMIIQLTASCSYEELKIIALIPPEKYGEWEWLRWLPHCMDEGHNHRYIAYSKDEATELLSDFESDMEQRLAKKDEYSARNSSYLPYVIVLALDPELMSGTKIRGAILSSNNKMGAYGIYTGMHIDDFPNGIHQIIDISKTEGKLFCKQDISSVTSFSKEYYTGDKEQLDAYARRMAPVRLQGGQSDKNLPSIISLFDGLGIQRIEDLDIGDYWRKAAPEETMSVPIGVSSNGSAFYFDIHEKAHGVHGVVAGKTGCGKTETIQSWIAMMSVHFSPEDVNFVMVDFKGTGLLAPFAKLPHLAGTISNLDKDISRNLISLKSEMTRRMQLLKDVIVPEGYGDKPKDIIEYRRLRKIKPELEPLPFLILLFDEFAAFKKEYPEYIPEIDTIFQEGRALGVFVIIMTQKPSGIITEQIRSNVGFRICLKVQSEADSKEILGRPDAATILNPGRAYIKAATESNQVFELIQSYYASGNYSPDIKEKAAEECEVYLVEHSGKRIKRKTEDKSKSYANSELSVLVERLAQYCKENNISAARPIWTKSLPDSLCLNDILPENLWETGWGWNVKEYHCDMENEFYIGPSAVIGLEDDPSSQKQQLFSHDFWKDGSIAIYGAPFTGKSTMLQTALVSMFLKYTPAELHVCLVDCGSYQLRALENFPHVALAGGDDEPEIIDSILDWLLEEIQKRRALYRKAGTGSPQAYAEATGQVLPTIVLAMDNLNQLLNGNFEWLGKVNKIAQDGVSRGIYLMCSFNGVNGVPMQLQQNIKMNTALQLNDKSDYSSIVGRITGTGLEAVLGRGYKKTGKQPMKYQTALPGKEKTDGKRIREIREIAAAMDESWDGIRPGKALSECGPSFTVDENGRLLLGATEDGENISIAESDAQGMLVSLSGKAIHKRPDFVKMLIQQNLLINDSQCFVFSENKDVAAGLNSGRLVVYNTASELDKNVESIAQILRDRQKDGQKSHDRLLIVIDGLKECINKAQQDTILRLEAIVNLGAGLNVYLVAIDQAEDLANCIIRGNLLAATLKEQGQRLLYGGTPGSHVQLIGSLKLPDREMDAGEAYYICRNDYYNLKIMQSQGEE